MKFYNFIIIVIFNLCCSSGLLFGLTDTALRNAENIKKDLTLLLAQDTGIMTAEQYAEWQKKVQDGLAYVNKIYPGAVTKYEEAVKLRQDNYALKQKNMNPILKPESNAQVVDNQGIVLLENAINQLALLPEKVKNQVTIVSIMPGALPDFNIEWDVLDAAEDLLKQLAFVDKLSLDVKNRFYDVYNRAVLALSNCSADLAYKVLDFLIKEKTCFPAHILFSTTVLSHVKQDKLVPVQGSNGWVDQIDAFIEQALMINNVLIQGVWQHNDLLIKVLPKVDAPKIALLKGSLNTIINGTKQNKKVLGLFDQIVFNWIDILVYIEDIVSVDSADKNILINIKNGVTSLIDYFACLHETETVLLQHYTQKGLEIAHVPLQGVELVVKMCNDLLRSIDAQISSSVTKLTPVTKSAPSIEQNAFLHDLIETLKSIESDVDKKMKTMVLPTTIPSFTDQYTHLVDVEELYKDTKLDFTKEEKNSYKVAAEHALYAIDDAVIATGVDTLTYIITKQRLLAKQLAYDENLIIACTKDLQKGIDVAKNKEFQDALKGAQSLKALFEKGLTPLASLSSSSVARAEVAAEVQLLKTHLNSLFNSISDGKNTKMPTGLFDKLVGAWINFFDSWKVAVKKLKINEVQQQQEKLKPLFDLMSCYVDCVLLVQHKISKVIPVEHLNIDTVSFITAFKNMVDLTKAASFIEAQIESNSLQQKQVVKTGQPVGFAAPTLPSETGSKAVSKALDALLILSKGLEQAMTTLDIAKGIVPDMQKYFDAVQKNKDSFDFDSAVEVIKVEDEQQVKVVFEEKLVYGVKQTVNIGAKGVEVCLPDINKAVEGLLKIIKEYKADTTKVALLKKDTGMKAVLALLKKVDEALVKTVFQCAAIKNITVKETIPVEALVGQLNLLVDHTVKNDRYVGALNKVIDSLQLFINEILAYMKTLSVDKVVTYQKELLFLQDPFAMVDKWVIKIQSIVDGKRITIKNGLLSSSLAAMLQKITDPKNAKNYAKGSTVEAVDVQRALISITDIKEKPK